MLQQLGWQDLQSLRRDLRLALLYNVVTGHVGIQPEHVGLVAADNKTRAEHQFKFRAVGSSTQLGIPPLFCGSNHTGIRFRPMWWNSQPQHLLR